MVDDNPKYGRRFRRIALSGELIAKAFREWPDVEIVKGSLPVDAIYVGAIDDLLNGSLSLVFYSAEFDPIDEGRPIPLHEILVGKRPGPTSAFVVEPSAN